MFAVFVFLLVTPIVVGLYAVETIVENRDITIVENRDNIVENRDNIVENRDKSQRSCYHSIARSVVRIKIWYAYTFNSSIKADLPMTSSYLRMLHTLTMNCVLIGGLAFGVSFIVTLSFKLLDSDNTYNTQSYNYRYLTSFAYLSGSTPATVVTFSYLLIAWMYLKIHYKSFQTDLQNDQISSSPETDSLKIYPVLVLVIVAIVLVGSSLLVYTGYVTARDSHFFSSDELSFVQWLLAVFDSVFTGVGIPFLLRKVSKALHIPASVYVRTSLLVRLLCTACVPAFAAMIADESCLLEYFSGTPTITADYEVTSCSVWTSLEIKTVCLRYKTTTYTSIFHPQFVYGNSCRDTILRYFSPILVLKSIVSVLKVLFVFSLPLLLEYEKLPQFLAVPLQFLWPKSISSSWFSEIDFLIGVYAEHSIILFFGVLNPLLLIPVCMCLCARFALYQTALGRCVDYFFVEPSVSSAEVHRTAMFKGVFESQLTVRNSFINMSMSTCLLSSSCLMSLFVFEMALDSEHYTLALWRPLFLLFAVFFLYVGFHKQSKGRDPVMVIEMVGKPGKPEKVEKPGNPEQIKGLRLASEPSDVSDVSRDCVELSGSDRAVGIKTGTDDITEEIVDSPLHRYIEAVVPTRVSTEGMRI